MRGRYRGSGPMQSLRGSSAGFRSGSHERFSLNDSEAQIVDYVRSASSNNGLPHLAT